METSAISGHLQISNDLSGATIKMVATGSSLSVPGSVHRLLLHEYGGDDDTTAVIMENTIVGIHVPETHHNVPCSPFRRLGDLGSVVVRQGANQDGASAAHYLAKMGSVFQGKLAELVGTRCALWSNPDVSFILKKNIIIIEDCCFVCCFVVCCFVCTAAGTIPE